MINSQTIDNVTFYGAVVRGVEYTAYKTSWGNWQVMTHRQALGPRHVGGCKTFGSLTEMCSKVKAFAGLDKLIAE